MLWTDADFVTQADLLSLDADIVNVATANSITLTGTPTSIVRRGIEDAGNYLEGILVSFATYISSNDLSANHLAAVFYTGSQPNQRRRVTLGQISINGRSPSVWSELKQWVANQILIKFYTDAANRAQGDRYTTKRDSFIRHDVQRLWPLLQRSGIPIVYRPMSTPMALQDQNPGTWVASAVSGGGGYVATGPYAVSLTYVDQSKYLSYQSTFNAESDLSAPQTVTLTAGQAIEVNVTYLNPPNGAVPYAMLARGFTVPYNATGYNIYVAQVTDGVPGTFYLQNTQPIPIITSVAPVSGQALPLQGTLTYTLPVDPSTSNPFLAAGQGQYPEAFLSIQNLIQRG